MAMVPDSECKTPTLIVSVWAKLTLGAAKAAMLVAKKARLDSFILISPY
jgi:hypothetical protein